VSRPTNEDHPAAAPPPVAGVTTTVGPAPVIEPQERVGRGFLALFGLLNFGLYLTVMMPALFSLPYKVQTLDPDGKTLSLGIVATVGAVVSLVAGPAAGVLSDRTRSRWGRRRPWLLGGIVVAIVGSIMVALAPNLILLVLEIGRASCREIRKSQEAVVEIKVKI